MIVVITGASSGIGRATALRFAAKGATVVLTARSESALRQLASECERLGARTLVLPADVTDEASLHELAQLAAGAFQRIDVWVNNAEESLFVSLKDTPPEAFRQQAETHLAGYLQGARAALPAFRQQGHGVLVINVSSVFGTLGASYQNAYATSKYALRGLSECLRLEGREAHVRVVTVLPATLTTPLLHQGASATHKRVKTLEPLYAADRIARAIVRSALHPRGARSTSAAWPPGPGSCAPGSGAAHRRLTGLGPPARARHPRRPERPPASRHAPAHGAAAWAARRPRAAGLAVADPQPWVLFLTERPGDLLMPPTGQ